MHQRSLTEPRPSQELEKLKKRREDSEETGQELRLAREQLQNTVSGTQWSREGTLPCGHLDFQLAAAAENDEFRTVVVVRFHVR